MNLARVAPAFVEMAHRIIWATVATASSSGEIRTRVLHPLWEWDGSTLSGVIATYPTPLKRKHLGENPRVSLNYWDDSQDACTAECDARLHTDVATKRATWDKFASTPECRFRSFAARRLGHPRIGPVRRDRVGALSLAGLSGVDDARRTG